METAGLQVSNPGHFKDLENYQEREFPTVGVYRGQIIQPFGLHGKGIFVYVNGDTYEGSVSDQNNPRDTIIFVMI